MADELIDIYDENNEPIGITKMKNEAHEIGLWHRIVHVWIYNSNREVLLQLRAKNKELYPGRWDISVAGHVGAGENIELGALREIKEEIGLLVKESDLEFWKIKKHKTVFNNLLNNEFFYIYFLKYDGDVNDLIIQKEELDEVRFISIDKLRGEIGNHFEKFTGVQEYWLDLVEKIENLKIN